MYVSVLRNRVPIERRIQNFGGWWEDVVTAVLMVPSVFFLLVLFFFSSRRRHTRYWRDWSSDVCSSDLPGKYREPFYKEVYQIFGSGSFHHALILGAGTGSDTAFALKYGVDSITAVEIDPTIQHLGAQLHPDKPYSSPRVHVVINDGRSFLQNTP